MLTPVKPTPIPFGKDARAFLARIEEGLEKEFVDEDFERATQLEEDMGEKEPAVRTGA